jgi:predicted TPR repeat methyltransferase
MRLGARATAPMPEGYVRALFDGYAPGFDKALTEGLGYRAPDLLFNAVQAAHAEARMKFGSVLDLGCGTGLAALPFRPYSDWMVGVDLSAAMLAQAREKGLYDRLIEAEVQHYLTDEAKIGAHYHLVLAADVFMYFDDLGPVLKATAQVVAPAGQLAFSVETHDGDGVLLRETLRYAHSEAHVRRLMAAAGLEPVSLDFASTRTEKGVPVPGLIVLAKP